jgi:polyphosphate kinase
MASVITEATVKEAKAAKEKIELPESLLYHKNFLFNRELSWLEFNRRVLEEALDQTQPLLERLKFLSIFSTNLDEFFMIRVSGLKDQLEDDAVELSPDGMMPAEQLKEIRERLLPMLDQQMSCLCEDVLPKLEAEGIKIKSYRFLTDEEKHELNIYFMQNVFPVLTPQAVDPSHKFPYISNLSLNLGLIIEPDESIVSATKTGKSEARFARIKVPPIVPRLVPIGNSETCFTWLGELIAANAALLFPGMRVKQSYLFRVTRDADIEIREDEAGDLLRVMEQELRQRRFGTAIRLEVQKDMPDEMEKFLTQSIGLTADDVYRINGPLNAPDLMSLYKLEKLELKDKPLHTTVPEAFKKNSNKSIFDIIKQQDVLVHHPYTTYSTVTDFIHSAAKDPDVLAIKICLYRTGQPSPIVQALMEASESGKQVAALVELKARFDEENNIGWARRLERAGVHVVYGLLGLKTHCKLALVVRRENHGLKRYVHIATGNYNPTTSRIYTDFGLFTTDEQIGADATDLFNYLTGYSRQSQYRKLLVAPVNMRERIIKLIERETENALEGRQARIIAKINSITDTRIIRSLYKASQAGVEIDLIVRGVCILRPGVEGLSENVRVRSIVGRFLEHSRIFYFLNEGNEEIFIGSADWMKRNLSHRVEVITPISDPNLRRYLKEEVLISYLQDNVKARKLLADGSYERVGPSENENTFESQAFFVGRSI